MRSFFAALGLLLAAALPACAQNYWPTPGGSNAQGQVDMCLNSSGQAVPVSSGNCVNYPGTAASPTAATLTPSAAPTAGLSTVSSTALEGSHTIASGAHNLYSFQISADSTLSAAAWWVLITDATTAPSGAVTPKKCYAMPSGTVSFSGAYLNPLAFTTGIEIETSTTGCFTATASAHAFISGDYK
jgi:hypothetical protein